MLRIKNETSFKSLSVFCEGKNYIINKNAEIHCETQSDETDIVLILPEKNKVVINWILALIDGFLSEECVINSLSCNCSFKVTAQNENSLLVLKDLVARDDKHGYIYQSVFVDSEDAVVGNTKFRLQNIDKSKKKTLLYFIFVTSGFPMALISTIFALISFNIGFLIATFVFLLMFGIPSWKKARKVKLYYSENYVNDFLLKKRMN